jgi:anti-sigma factor RsiW
MKPCGVDEAELGAFFDGELDAMAMRRMEAHLATCPDCADEADRTRAIRAMLKKSDVSYKAPEKFEAEMARVLARRSSGVRQARLKSSFAFWRDWGSALATAASVAAIALWFVPGMRDDPLSRDLVADHVRSLMADHLTDVATSDRHTVKPWFAGKTAFSPPVVDLADQGFPLVGGRLDYAGGHPVAALVYKHKLHVINVFVWAPGPDKPETASAATSRDGYNLLRWETGGLVFAAVSDLNAQELEELRDLIAKAALSS